MNTLFHALDCEGCGHPSHAVLDANEPTRPGLPYIGQTVLLSGEPVRVRSVYSTYDHGVYRASVQHSGSRDCEYVFVAQLSY
jgi:hypothetical protein